MYWRKDNALRAIFVAHRARKTHRNSRFDDNRGVLIASENITNNRFDRAGIKIIALRVVIRGGSDDDIVGILIGGVFVAGRRQGQTTGGQSRIDIRICNR